MKTQKISLLAALAAGALIASAPALYAQTNTVPTTPGAGEGREGRGGARTVDAQLARLTEQLTLTEEQKPKVKAVLEDQATKRAGLRDLAPEERRTKNQELREEMAKKMKEILTEEQYKKYEALPRGGRGQGAGGQGEVPRRERPNAGGGGAQ
jgi:Spy/CpxP family protein refolding chaperone